MKQSKLFFAPKEKQAVQDKPAVDPLLFFSKKVSQKPPVVVKKSKFFNDTEIDNVLMTQGDVLEKTLEPMDVSDENNPIVQPVEAADPVNKETGKDTCNKEGTEEPKKKFNYYAHKQKLAQMPKAQGSKEIPVGEENCLGGLAFVFTGELSSISREEAIDLVKRYGA
jgi:NAD-dependent DNA ligase